MNQRTMRLLPTTPKKPAVTMLLIFFLDNSKLASAFSETENGKRKTENGFLIRQLQKLFPDLDLTLADLPPRTEKAAKNYRKISEKSAKNTLGLTKNSQQNQRYTPSGKKYTEKSRVGRETTALFPPSWRSSASRYSGNPGLCRAEKRSASRHSGSANRKRSFVLIPVF